MLDTVLKVLKVVGIIVIPLAALFIARRTLLQGKQDLHPALAPAYAPAPHHMPNMSQMTNRVVMTEVPPAQATIQAPVREQSLAQKEVVALAESDPSQVAQLIRMWMSEEK